MSTRVTKRGGAPSVGSRVKFVFGLDEVTATVIEDRGNIGIGGRRLLRVRVDISDTSEPIELEIPVDDVKVAA
jgi:hypothetical protein